MTCIIFAHRLNGVERTAAKIAWRYAARHGSTDGLKILVRDTSAESRRPDFKIFDDSQNAKGRKA